MSDTQNNPGQIILKPVDMTLDEAAGSLTYFETQGMRANFNVGLNDMATNPEAVIYALVWTLERRHSPKLPAKVIKELPIIMLDTYFQADDLDQTEDSEQGKDESGTEPNDD